MFDTYFSITIGFQRLQRGTANDSESEFFQSQNISCKIIYLQKGILFFRCKKLRQPTQSKTEVNLNNHMSNNIRHQADESEAKRLLLIETILKHPHIIIRLAKMDGQTCSCSPIFSSNNTNDAARDRNRHQRKSQKLQTCFEAVKCVCGGFQRKRDKHQQQQP